MRGILSFRLSHDRIFSSISWDFFQSLSGSTRLRLWSLLQIDIKSLYIQWRSTISSDNNFLWIRLSILFVLELICLHSSGITKQSVVNDMARVVLRIVFDVSPYTIFLHCSNSLFLSKNAVWKQSQEQKFLKKFRGNLILTRLKKRSQIVYWNNMNYVERLLKRWLCRHVQLWI